MLEPSELQPSEIPEPPKRDWQNFFKGKLGIALGVVAVVVVAVLIIFFRPSETQPQLLENSVSRAIKLEWKTEADDHFTAILESADTLEDGSYTSEAEAVYTFEGSLAKELGSILTSGEYFFDKEEALNLNEVPEFTRADLAALVVRALGLPTNIDFQNPFDDVSKDDWFYPYVGALANEGLFLGETAFQPDLPAGQDLVIGWVGALYGDDESELEESALPRKELAVLVVEAANLDTVDSVDNPFRDIKTSDWFYPFVATLVDAGVFESKQYFRPEAGISRAEAAQVLFQAFGFEQELDDSADSFVDVTSDSPYYTAVQTLANLGIIDTNTENFYPNETMLREDFFEWIRAAQKR